MKNIFILLLLPFCSTLYGQNILSSIPDSLLEDTHSVVLNEDFKFTILDEGKSVEELKKIYVVLKNSKSVSRNISFYQDKFTKIIDIKINIFDSNNNFLESYDLSDFSDISLVAGGVAGDASLKSIQLSAFPTPYKVEVYRKVRYNSSFSYPEWNPVQNEHTSVLNAQLSVIDKTANNLRFRSVNIGEPLMMKIKNEQKYLWKVHAFKAIEYEKYNYKSEDYFPIVSLSPNQFAMDGYEGNMSSWKAFGQWIYKLNAGRNTLNPEEQAEIKALVKDSQSQVEKVKTIYKYLQDNTRYASIQLGIGGFQPFESGFVHKKKYGDCKALSYYAQSMLKVLDIPSYYTLVRAGRNTLDVAPDFPNNKFNHVFLMVPLENDTIWLECTSQNNPFGYLGHFTDDRNVLLISENGGQLIRSKKYAAEDDMTHTLAKLQLAEDGSAELKLQHSMEGLAIMDQGFFGISEASKSAQKNWLYDELDIGSYDLKDFWIAPITEGGVLKGKYSAQIKLHNFATKTGKRLIFSPFLFNNLRHFKLTKTERKHPIYIKNAYIQLDSIQINIPKNYNAENTLKYINLKTTYGEYSRKYTISENSILCIRKFTLLQGNYPASDYVSFRDFMEKVRKGDKQKLVFVKEAKPSSSKL